MKDRLKYVNGKEITYSSNPLNLNSYSGNTYTFEGGRLTEYRHSGGIIYYRYNNQGVGSKYYYNGENSFQK